MSDTAILWTIFGCCFGGLILAIIVCVIMYILNGSMEERINEILNRYEQITPSQVTAITISNFHKELQDAFDSDKQQFYCTSGRGWNVTNIQHRISAIDNMLLNYLKMNQEATTK